MGANWCPLEHTVVFETPDHTSAETTQSAVQALCDAGIELLLYAGGDGTTRDIVEALTIPISQSSVFQVVSRCTADVLPLHPMQQLRYCWHGWMATYSLLEPR